MDYEKKYNEALERAKAILCNLGEGASSIRDIETIFPELAESEDERMKKAIVHVLYENYSDAAVIEGVEIAEIIAWLEKQKKPENVSASTMCPSCWAEEPSLQKGQKKSLSERFRPDYRLEKNKAIGILEDYLKWAVSSEEECSYTWKELADAIQLGIDSMKGQKPTDRFEKAREKYQVEWSYPHGRNETADRLVSLAECLEMDGDCLFNGYSGTECGKFLRELARKQIGCKPAEWSEEDKKVLDNVSQVLIGLNYQELAKNYKQAIEKLLHSRPSWKPSEEQMDV